MSECPICKSQLGSPTGGPPPFALNCPRCGPFLITDEALAILKTELGQKPLRWAITSHAIQRLHVQGGVHTLTPSWLQAVWVQEKLPRPQEQADILVQFLAGDDVAAGDWVPCKPQSMTALLGTADNPIRQETAGFTYVLGGLKDKGLIEERQSSQSGSVDCRLTFPGWERLDQLQRQSVESRVAFMAMGYGNDSVDRAFKAFINAVAQTGFELRRLDLKPKAGLIDLRMRVEIRSAKFLVADLTDDNRGAYWEAGFAEGLGKKVYYTCEEAKFGKAKTHFDTEHLLTIKWLPDDFATAADDLKSAIRNDFPTEAKQSD
jgi:hypothetical protein